MDDTDSQVDIFGHQTLHCQMSYVQQLQETDEGIPRILPYCLRSNRRMAEEEEMNGRGCLVDKDSYY